MSKHLARFTLNAQIASVRHETLEGRPYVAVPMVMLKEGVLNGSSGPTFYPGDECRKAPQSWNHKPVVVYHPTINGVGVSACEPAIIESYKVGLIMNTRWADDKLASEAWIDADKANKVDSRVMEAIEGQKMMELSTGLFTDNEASPGTWNGIDYTQVARNYNPDHLALLPDKLGALSIADGAGFMRNELKGLGDGDAVRQRFQAYINSGLAQLHLNELSISAKLDALYEAVTKATNGDGWLVEAFADYVVVRHADKLWKMSYATSGEGVTILADKTEVTKVVSYPAAVATNSKTPKKSKTHMSKATLIAALGERLKLNAEEIDKLNELPESLLEKAHVVTNAAPTPFTPPADIKAFIAMAAPEHQAILNAGIATHNEQKKTLVDSILAAPGNALTADFLNNQELGNLRAIAALIPAPPAPVTGNAAALGTQVVAPQFQQPIGNGQFNPNLLGHQLAMTPNYVGSAGVAPQAVTVNAADTDGSMIPKPMSFGPAAQ